jgi:hypothetical protein
MLWKFFLLYVIVMPVLMLAYFIVALAAPQLGWSGGAGLLWGAAISSIVALPVSWYIAKKLPSAL